MALPGGIMKYPFEYSAQSVRFRLQSGGKRMEIEVDGVRQGTASSQVVLPDGSREDVVWSAGSTVKGEFALRGSTAGGSWTLRVRSCVNARGLAGLRVVMSGTARRGKNVLGLVPLAFSRLQADHVVLQGRSAGGCRAIAGPGAGENVKSHLMMMVRRGASVLQIAQPLRQNNPSHITGRFRGGFLHELSVTTPFDLAYGVGRLTAEPVSLFVSDDGHGLMEAWAEEQAAGVIRPAPPPPLAGWNSWDYYRWTITEDAVLGNAEFIAADPVLSRHVKRIIIDDGWQYAYGEWDPNHLFPHGMEWLARRLSKLGFEPGIWMAPGIVEPQARIAQWETDMLARGVSGLPCICFTCMARNGFVLDPTVHKTRQWLHSLFTRYADMGFKYFKLDFLSPVARAPRYSDKSVPRGRIVETLLEPARQALAGRAHIMGCGYDFHAGIGCVDEVRTSSDIHARWDSICGNVGSIAGRWWAQSRWWGNDPDFALARGPQTSDDPDLQRLLPSLVNVKPNETQTYGGEFVLATMNRDEARVLLSLVVVSGGAVNLSDNLMKLNEEGLDLVRRTVAAPRGCAGVPLDLFASERPAKWIQRTSAGWRVLLINWSDAPKELALDIGAFGISAEKGRNFWTDKTVKARGGVLTTPLPPHACLLVEFQ